MEQLRWARGVPPGSDHHSGKWLFFVLGNISLRAHLNHELVTD